MSHYLSSMPGMLAVNKDAIVYRLPILIPRFSLSFIIFVVVQKTVLPLRGVEKICMRENEKWHISQLLWEPRFGLGIFLLI